MNKFRPRITREEFDVVQQYRAIKNNCDEQDIDLKTVKHGWLKSKNTSLFFKNPQFEDQQSQKLQQLKLDIIEDLKQHSPVYPAIKRTKSTEGHLLVIDPADVHIGKLATAFETGEDYNQQIAVKRVHEGVQGILDKSSGFQIEKILFIGGTDILHIDTPKRQTTS